MGVSTIYVNKRGSPASSTNVALSFSAGGMTPSVCTDKDGKAVIHHDGSGTATVFINGKRCGTIRAPATEAFGI